MSIQMDVNLQNYQLQLQTTNPPKFDDFMQYGPGKTPFSDLLRRPTESSSGQSLFGGQNSRFVGQLLQALGRAMERAGADYSFYGKSSAGSDQFLQQLMQMIGDGGDGSGGGSDDGGDFLSKLLGGGSGGGGFRPFLPCDSNGGSFSPPSFPFGSDCGSQPMTENSALETIADNFMTLSQGKRNFSTDDLKNAAASDKNPQLAAAAQYMIDNPDAMKRLDTAFEKSQGKDGKVDNNIDRSDITAALSNTGFGKGEEPVVMTMMKYSGSLFSNGLLDKDKLQQVANGKMPDGSAAPPDLQLAAKKVLSSPELFDKLDSALFAKTGRLDAKNAGLDGEISLADLQTVSATAAKNGTSTNYFTGASLMGPVGSMLFNSMQRSGLLDPSQLSMFQSVYSGQQSSFRQTAYA